MLIGLVLTGVTAWATADTSLRDVFFQVTATGRIGMTGLGWVVFLAPLAMVFFLSFGINRIIAAAAQATFWLYVALLVGIGIAPILWIYTGASVASTFFVTAAMFGAMSLWGYNY